jgi:hypothetical protein
MLVEAESVLGWRDELTVLTDRLGALFVRPEPRRQAGLYLEGLLGGVERKNGWQLAEQIGDAWPWRTQRVLSHVQWDQDAACDICRDYVIEHIGSADGGRFQRRRDPPSHQPPAAGAGHRSRSDLRLVNLAAHAPSRRQSLPLASPRTLLSKEMRNSTVVLKQSGKRNLSHSMESSNMCYVATCSPMFRAYLSQEFQWVDDEDWGDEGATFVQRSIGQAPNRCFPVPNLHGGDDSYCAGRVTY